MMKIAIVEEVNLNQAYTYLESDKAGAINLFIGTVRDNAQGKKVLKLAFEAYESMALKEMNRIAQEACHRWPVQKLIIQHVIGEKEIGEPVVITGVSAAHRQAAFEACQFLIDELKKTVPIWKKEYYTDNSIWVNARP